MGYSYCFVPGCDSGRQSNRERCKKEGKKIKSLFSAPRDPELLEKWKSAIPQEDKEFTKDNSICELHFLISDIERYFITNLPGGAVSKIERENPRLRPGAIPCIFPNNPGCLSKPSTKRKSTEETDMPAKIIKENPINLDDCNNEVITASSQDNSLKACTENVHFKFTDLLQNIDSVKLPGIWWNSFVTNRFIIFARWNSDYAPEKRVVVEYDFNVKVFLKNKEITVPDHFSAASIDQLTSLLKEVHEYSICAGVDDKSMVHCSIVLKPNQHKSGVKRTWCEECGYSRKIQLNAERLRRKFPVCEICKRKKCICLTEKVLLNNATIDLMKKSSDLETNIDNISSNKLIL